MNPFGRCLAQSSEKKSTPIYKDKVSGGFSLHPNLLVYQISPHVKCCFYYTYILALLLFSFCEGVSKNEKMFHSHHR